MSWWRIIPVVGGILLIGLGSYVGRSFLESKTLRRMNQKINFECPKNYCKNDLLETDLSRILLNGYSEGVWVLCAPKNTGKTTAVKKILKQFQDDGGFKELVMHNGDNNRKNVIIQLKPVYINMEILNYHDPDWFDNEFDSKDKHLDELIPKGTKAIIVLDHMKREILDGFEKYNPRQARSFYSYHAVSSYNHGKYIILVITDDPLYAKDILKYTNGGEKVHTFSNPLRYLDSCTHEERPSAQDWDKFRSYFKASETLSWIDWSRDWYMKEI